MSDRATRTDGLWRVLPARAGHNNPSLVFRPDGRIAVFFSPHSGHDLPPPGIPSLMRYRIAQDPFSIDAWGPVRTVPTNAPGDLGVPVRMSELDVVYRYSSSGGRAWPHDIALQANGRPRIVYTRRKGGPFGRDTFWYAYHNGERWVSRKIVEAGAGRQSFTSGGATFDHEDPRFVYLSRTIGRWNQVERWFTPDDGRTWTTRQLTDDADHYSIRPVTPRGLADADRILFSRGDETTISFTNYRTRVHALDF